MKAKIIKTGEIVDVFLVSMLNPEQNNHLCFQESNLLNSRVFQEKEIEIIDNENISENHSDECVEEFNNRGGMNMALIDKSAIVAELKTRIDLCNKFADAAAEHNLHNTLEANELLICEYKRIISFLDTLEVKEVDLEKEIKEQTDIYYNMCEKKLKEMSDDDTDLSFLTLDSYAKHFYELGLKAQKGE